MAGVFGCSSKYQFSIGKLELANSLTINKKLKELLFHHLDILTADGMQFPKFYATLQASWTRMNPIIHFRRSLATKTNCLKV